ncbi:group II intron reverse transcriptase/maturase [Erysipelotrichaceae bacterium HCN-30851]
MIRKLHDNEMCDAFEHPTSIKRLLFKPVEDIITYGNQILRGLISNNQGCTNYYEMHRIQYIIQYYIAYTIACKYNTSLKKVFRKYYSQLTYSYTNDKGIKKTIKLALYRSFKKDKTFFPQWLNKIKQDMEYKYRDTNPLKRKCYICGNLQQHVMFHRKKISLLHIPYSNIVKEMVRINRRQICLCTECFTKVSQNLLEFNQITKRKLT